MTETSTANLAEWLLERLAEDERENSTADEPVDWCDRSAGTHYEHSRVAAEIAAKRQIIAMWTDPESVRSLPTGVHDGRDPDEVEAEVRAAEAIDQVVRIHAAVYAAQGRPGYRPEWRPE